MSFSFEVWDPPGIATFVKKIAALRPLSASGTLYRRQTGRGLITLPADYSRLAEIINVDTANHANDVASTIRVYRGTDLIQELLVRASPNLTGGEPMTLDLEGIEAVMDWAIVEAWDWDGSADFNSTVPDWIYGGRNLIPDLALGDLGSIREEWELYNDQTPGGSFTLTVEYPSSVTDTTNSLDFDATLDELEGSPLTGNGLEGLSNVDDVTVSGSGTAADPWLITFYSPPDIVNLTKTDTGLTSTLTKITEGDPDPSPVTVSQTVDASVEAGVHGCDPPISVVTTPLDTGADWSLLVEASCRFDGSQIVLPVTPGQTYQASIRIRPTVTGLYTLVIRDEFENLIKNPTPRDNLLTAGSFQTISVSDIEIPPGVDRIIMRAAVTDPTAGNWADFYVNWQGAEFREGQQATTAGNILLELLADAQTDHASSAFARSTIDFINASFDGTNDSAGNAWADSELSVNIPRGMTYRKVLERVFGQLGYEWDLTPTSGTPGEWDLNVWNPDGRGADWSAADTPSILTGQGTESASATRRLPSGNIIISEGGDLYSSRAASAASYGAIGRREWYQSDISYTSTQVEDWTDKQLARFLDETLNPRFEIADPPPASTRPVPVVDFGLADTMNVDLADGTGKVSREVDAISWRTVDDGIRWGVHLGDVQFDSIGGGGSASRGSSGPVDEGVRRLIDQFDRVKRQPVASAFVPSKGGNAPSVVVATADSSDFEKARADFIGDGVADHVAIMAAYASLGSSAGRILLCSGNYVVAPGEVVFNDSNIDDVAVQGVGMFSTIVTVTGTSGAAFTAGGTADATFANLTITASGAGSNDPVYGIYFNQSGSGLVENVNFSSVPESIRIATNDVDVIGCRAFFGRFFIRADDAGYSNVRIVRCYTSDYIHLENVTRVNIWGNSLGASVVGTDARGWIIHGNQWSGVSTWSSALIEVGGDNTGSGDYIGCVITDNLLQAATGDRFITADGLERVIIANNAGSGGIVASSCVGINIGGNSLVPEFEGAVAVTSCDNAVIHDNTIRIDVDASDNTYDLVSLTTTDRALVEGNKLILNSGVGDSSPRYGVNVVSGECNMVVGNDLGDPDDYGTDALNDTASNTQLFWPADPTYGDNLTDCGSGS